LTAAQSGAATASAGASGYVNPLANASVRAERIDQGVDYAGTGTVGALGPGVVTQVVPSGSGWEGGGYVEYKLTAGPYAGRYVFAAEGVTPTVSVGQTVSAGQPVATIIPGRRPASRSALPRAWGQSAYASRYGGGYSEGQLTAPGQAFSNLIASLGGPAGLAEGRQVVGHFP
jgi:biotin carboxyl carrier protein